MKTNNAERTKLPKIVKKEIKPLTDEQVRSFLIELEQEEYADLYRTIIFTGLREAEAIGLTWDCIDFKKGILTIKRQLQKRPKRDGGYTFAPLKNDKTRILTVPHFVMTVLENRQTKQNKEKEAAGDFWNSPQTEDGDSLVFTTPTGDPINPKVVYLHYKKIAERIGAPYSRVHDLRHTFAVLSLQNGDDVKTVQENLGHATAAFTLDIYGHVSEKMKSESAARMQSYITNITKKSEAQPCTPE